MPVRGVYVLESEYSWDHKEIGFATITVEKPDRGFDQIADPDLDKFSRNGDLATLRSIADSQAMNGRRESKFRALWKVADNKRPQIFRGQEYGQHCLIIPDLELICTFDSDGNPVAPEYGDPNQSE